MCIGNSRGQPLNTKKKINKNKRNRMDMLRKRKLQKAKKEWKMNIQIKNKCN
jgi:hypothetical protein